MSSWRLAFATFALLSVPLAASLVLVWFTSNTITLGATIGLIGVVGLGSRQAVLLVRHYHHLQRSEGIPFGADLVIRGTRDRLPPLVTGTVATILYLLPFVIGASRVGFEIVQPMAVAVVGGLIGTLVMAVLCVPMMYHRLADVGGTPAWIDDLFEDTPVAPDVELEMEQ